MEYGRFRLLPWYSIPVPQTLTSYAKPDQRRMKFKVKFKTNYGDPYGGAVEILHIVLENYDNVTIS